MIKLRLRNNKASILILVLWILGLLSLFAGQIGLTIGQRIKLLAKIEQNSRLRYLVNAGIKKGIAALRSDLEDNNNAYTPFGKYYRHSNEDLFKNTELGEGSFEISFKRYDLVEDKEEKRYGISDEAGRLNINLAPRAEIGRLIQRIGGIPDQQVVNVTDAIVGWRQEGDADLEGFYSDEFYYNLEHIYQAKDAEFEVLEELMLVQDMTPQLFERLLPYITIYGDGKVNINTASSHVLYALGLEDSAIQKIISVRRGVDGIDATIDDHIFRRPYDIAIEMRAFVELDSEERAMIDQVNARQRFTTNSQFYRIESTAQIENRKGEMYAYCIYNAADNWVEYYYEK